MVLFAGSCKSGKHREHNHPVPPVQPDPMQEAYAWADSICNGLSLEEQVAQLVMPAIYSNSDASTVKKLKWYTEDLKVGGILLLKGDGESAASLTDTLVAIRDRTPYSPGTFLALDAENGLGMRFSDAPVFPWNNKIDRRADSITFYDYGREIGREAGIVGVNMILGPVVDVSRIEDPSLNVMTFRSLGSDQLRIATLSSAYSKGVESRGIISVMKHFPGHGPTSTDSHKKLSVVDLPESDVFTVDLMPFREGVKSGVSGIMVGHIWAIALDTVPRPASFSDAIISQLLRKDMGFKGLVLVDAVNMAGAEGFTGADAINAGADILIAPIDTQKEINDMVKAVSDNLITPERIRESCRRILAYKFSHGIHSYRRDMSDPRTIKERLHQEAPQILSRLKRH